LANTLLWFGVMAAQRQQTTDQTLSLTMNGLVALNMVYVAVHSALRPENVCSERFLAFISNPLLYLLASDND
jgi:hypothetical protein